MKIGDKKINYCIDCYKPTNHAVIAFKEVDGPDDYQETYFYSIVQCAGCDKVSYRTENVDYEQAIQYDDENWGPDVIISTYPQLLENHRKLKNTYYLPNEIRNIYDEAINAFSSKCYLLTAIAYRGIIEAICKDKSITGNDLNIQINKMVKNGLITQKEAERLHAVRFLGNDSVHEMSIPKPKQLFVVLDIIEHLLKNLYLIDKELNANLETIFQNFSEFKNFLSNQISKLKIGDILPLNLILGKSTRRLNVKATNLEKELIETITNGEYKYLKIGEVRAHKDSTKGMVQYYEVVETEVDFEDIF